MKAQKIITGMFLLLLGVTGCQDKWDAHYENENGGGEASVENAKNLLEYIRSVPDYSGFVSLLEETGIAPELAKKQILTVWIPVNGNIPAEMTTPPASGATEAEIALAMAEKKQFVKNHINNIALFFSKLQDEKMIKMHSGKNLMIREIGEEEFSIDGLRVTDGDQICKNGVVHEIEGSLIPRKNIFDYVCAAGDDYSMYRDTLLSKSDTVFDPDASFALGVDEVGNTIYDSVFVITNPYLSKGNINSEDRDYTLFLPTNSAIEEMYREMQVKYTDMGLNMTYKDSMKFFDWVMKASIYEGKIVSCEDGTSYKSVYGLEWRNGKQRVDPVYQSFSNGYVYKTTDLYIPKYYYLSSLEIWYHYLFDLTSDEEEQKKYYEKKNVIEGKFKKYSWPGVAFDGPADKKSVYSGTFKSLIKNSAGQIVEGKVMPGTYGVYASFKKMSKCGNVKIYINDRVVATVNSADNKFNLQKGLVVERFEITEQDGFNPIWIKLENLDKKNTHVCAQYLRLEPTNDNY